MKFIYLADTHIGGSDSVGYRKQPRYLKNIQEIMECLKKYMEEAGNIDFVIHGGDMVDETTPEAISQAVHLFEQLPCPVYLVLGNHDLTVSGAVEMWLKYAPQFFLKDKTDFRLVNDGVQIDGLLCNWGETPAYWSPEIPQVPWLFPSQLEQLTDIQESCRTRIIITHSPVYGLPPEQYGGTEPLHAPAGDLPEKISAVLDKASLMLGAHNHMNMALLKGDCHYVTASAFSEMPFEFKVVEIVREKLSMRTVGLSNAVSFRGDYDFESTYVQGRVCDRNIDRELPCV